jgi:hypothetical protein
LFLDKKKGKRMKYLRMSVLGITVACLCVLALGLVSCGKREEVAKKPTAGVTEEKKEVQVPSDKPITEERTFYNFETEDLDGWEIPLWAQGKIDYVATDAATSTDFASKGDSSMKVTANFPGGSWSAALVEIQQYLNMSAYRVVRVDVYLPEDAPIGLTAKIILTVGDNWKFVEMSRSYPLIPGEWVTITASIEPGSYDWKRIVPDETFAEDVRKVAVRIESNRKPKYSGTVYIDNVRVGR